MSDRNAAIVLVTALAERAYAMQAHAGPGPMTVRMGRAAYDQAAALDILDERGFVDWTIAPDVYPELPPTRIELADG